MPPQRIEHFRLVDKLGEGGMGVVYRAEDEQLNRAVAIKLLSVDNAQDPRAVERFHREARITSALRHPHICTVYEFGDFAGYPYMVMELLEGQTLQALMAGKSLPLDRLLEIGIHVAEALDAAHEKNIVHRDIKSTNIFITKSGKPKVLDFGLAKLAKSDPAVLTTTLGPNNAVSMPGLTLGTATHMSPEQVEGKELDRRSDIFSLGIVLYEMATGVLPFRGNNSALLMQAILSHPYSPPSQVNPELPVEFDRIIRKVLEKDRALRYQMVGELKADLLRLQRDAAHGRIHFASALAPVESRLSHEVSAAAAEVAVIEPWDAVARDSRDFAERGSGVMYWFRIPPGGIAYPVGFHSSLLPALENRRVTQIRFVLDSAMVAVPQMWSKLIIPLIQCWAKRKRRPLELEEETDRGRFIDPTTQHTLLSWIFTNLSAEQTPSFKIFVDEGPGQATTAAAPLIACTDQAPTAATRPLPDGGSGEITLERPPLQPAATAPRREKDTRDGFHCGLGEAEILLSTTTRSVRMRDSSQQNLRIPESILRIRTSSDEKFLASLCRVARRWDFLFQT